MGECAPSRTQELEKRIARGPLCLPEEYKPYEADESGIPAMADFGLGYRWHVTGLTHDASGAPTGKAR